jgi:hypothetical protein
VWVGCNLPSPLTLLIVSAESQQHLGNECVARVPLLRCSTAGILLAVVGLIIGLAGLTRVLFYKDPISD